MEQHLDVLVDVLARWSIRLAFEAWVEEAWEGHFPDIGQFDFDRIVEAAERLLPADVDLETFQATYNWFADRATEENE